MQISLRLVKNVGIAILLSITMPAFAESAPVYDADSMPQQQFDTAAEQNADNLPPPPAPEQQGGAFAPSPAQVNQTTNAMTNEQRMRRMEQQITNLQSNEVATKMEALQNQVQSLRDQVEQLTHQLQLVQNQQKTMYADVDKRLTQQLAKKPVLASVKTPSVAVDASNTSDSLTPPSRSTKLANKNKKNIKTQTSNAEPVATTDQPNVAEEQQIYQTAYNQIKSKKYDDAVNTLQSMLQKYPSGQFASNAHYWLGELFGLMGKNDQALSEFSTVLKTYPDSPRVSDAQLKVGLIYASQSKWLDAKNAFKRVINHYPGTASARLAAEHLKQIKQAGN